MSNGFRRSSEAFIKAGMAGVTRKVPTSDRPTYYKAPGLQAARLAAGMTVEEVARLCGYSPGVIVSMEAGQAFHTMEISRAASVIPGHDLRLIRGEGPGGPQVTRFVDSTREGIAR